VYGFEPHRGLVKSIKEAVALNQFDNLFIDNAALSSCSGKLKFCEN